MYGGPGALLHWVAYGFAQANPGGYFWTDVRLVGQQVDERDPLARRLIPDDHLSVVEPQELSRNDAPANAAIAEVVRSDEPPENIVQLADFLRLPTHTQALLSVHEPSPTPFLLVLSNGHRIAPQYPEHTVGPIVQAIVRAGVSLLMTFPDEPPKARFAFDNVWRLHGTEPGAWATAHLEVEKGSFGAPFTSGARIPLGSIGALASALAQARTPSRPP